MIVHAPIDKAPVTQDDVGMAKKKSKTLSEQVRQAMADADVTRYRISKDTGIDASVLAKFLHGERGVSLDTLDVLAEYLGLEIVVRPQRKGRK